MGSMAPRAREAVLCLLSLGHVCWGNRLNIESPQQYSVWEAGTVFAMGEIAMEGLSPDSILDVSVWATGKGLKQPTPHAFFWPWSHIGTLNGSATPNAMVFKLIDNETVIESQIVCFITVEKMPVITTNFRHRTSFDTPRPVLSWSIDPPMIDPTDLLVYVPTLRWGPTGTVDSLHELTVPWNGTMKPGLLPGDSYSLWISIDVDASKLGDDRTWSLEKLWLYSIVGRQLPPPFNPIQPRRVQPSKCRTNNTRHMLRGSLFSWVSSPGTDTVEVEHCDHALHLDITEMHDTGRVYATVSLQSSPHQPPRWQPSIHLMVDGEKAAEIEASEIVTSSGPWRDIELPQRLFTGRRHEVWAILVSKEGFPMLGSPVRVVGRETTDEEQDRGSVVGFYHIGIPPLDMPSDWTTIVRQQMQRILKSEAYRAASSLHVSVSGPSFNVASYLVTALSQDDPKIALHWSPDAPSYEREIPTLQRMYDHCAAHPKDTLFYLHTKGATRKRPPTSWTMAHWRSYMEYYILDHGRLCQHAIQHGGCDICGLDWRDEDFFASYFAGNFFWTSCAHIRRLPPPNVLVPLAKAAERRLGDWSEFWLAMAPDFKASVLHSTSGLFYLEPYMPEDYEDPSGFRNQSMPHCFPAQHSCATTPHSSSCKGFGP